MHTSTQRPQTVRSRSRRAACATTPLSSDAHLNIAEIYRQHAPLVRHRIRSFFSLEEEEEVLQEVFLRLLEQPEAFSGRSQLSTWLWRVTTNHCLNRLRDSKRRQKLWRKHHRDLWYAQRYTGGQDHVTLLRELWLRLPEELAITGIFYHLDGHTHAAIADMLGVSRRTVGHRLARLKALALKDAEAGPSERHATS